MRIVRVVEDEHVVDGTVHIVTWLVGRRIDREHTDTLSTLTFDCTLNTLCTSIILEHPEDTTFTLTQLEVTSASSLDYSSNPRRSRPIL